ncbi:MAG: hypothetical protein QM627_07945 [Luteolibacter sp.]
MDPAYAGVFYDRGSRISMPPFDLDSTAGPEKIPEIHISLLDLIFRSKLQSVLRSDESIESIRGEGLRFRIRVGLPSDGGWTEFRSEWIEIDRVGRARLIEYLEAGE